jgi:mannose-1-phosphate guanylyltransferase/mannose-6-phosphate isomerase
MTSTATSPMITPVILSGGVGTRLWPLSRRLRPKQFLALDGDQSMFAKTLARIQGAPFAAPVVVCNDEHRFLVAEELRMADIAAADILVEPAARNTAPAIAAAALRLLARDADAVMAVLPSDHAIADAAAFRTAIATAAELAQAGDLVTFGVPPTRPDTGYGYILTGDALLDGASRVAAFVEKPDTATAEAYLAQGNYLWNAGMFVFKAADYIAELERHRPEVVAAVNGALDAGHADLDFFRLGEDAFAAAPAISIDYAVMEKTSRAAVVPLEAGWSDVGSWASLWELGPADAAGNVTAGNAVVLDSTDTYVRSEHPLVATLGVTGLIVVATDDTVLVLPKERAQEVKELVAELHALGREEIVSHTRVYRPWGHYQNLEGGEGFLVKRIVVKPGAQLSMQYHHHRAEHWVVVAGTARVTNGDEVFDLGPNQSTYIPAGARHRLENPAGEPLHLIEVQSGNYIGEDDIVRLEDTYGRS